MKLDDLIGKITCADCLDILKQLPDKCVDLVLTDPPYGIGIDGQKQSICNNPKHNRKEHKQKDWDSAIPQKEVFDEKDPEYWKASCERLEQAQRQQTLF